MKIAILDTFSGISGDMVIGALISAGLPFEYLDSELNKLKLDGYKLSHSIVQKQSITAIKFDVQLIEESGHNHKHGEQNHSENHHHTHGRMYKEIVKIIDESELSQYVKEISKKIFEIIGEAEAKIHNVKLEQVHFHEIGAIDSIIDIVGCAIGLEYFNVKEIFSSVIPLGRGFVETQHGKMPVPAPATIEILKDYPVTFLDIPFELTTPTGAGIVKALSKGLIDYQRVKVSNIGYGAGSKNIPEIPNLFRLMIGEYVEGFSTDESYIVETNIDDMNPEFYPYVIERLLNAGAHDAYLVPIIMKKGRPGIILSTLCEANLLEEILKIIYRETTTLGVRILKIDRRKLIRDSEIVKTKFGDVKVKVIQTENGKKYVPEFEECKKIAIEKNIPISEVYNEIIKLNS
ncbi:MAG: nickel pincer cofactor biosynthesis protein LarC [Ignavibacteria bacterium]